MKGLVALFLYFVSFVALAGATAWCAFDPDKLSIHTSMNPFFLAGDYDGNGQSDAAVWIRNSRSKELGIAMFLRGQPKPTIVGAGTALYDRGEDYQSFDIWSLIPKGEVLESHWEDRQVKLRGDAILVAKSESSSHAIYWDGKKISVYWLTD